MNREQFIAQLARLLQDLPPAERQEAIRYYQEYFDDAGEENEDAVIQELGSFHVRYCPHLRELLPGLPDCRLYVP